MPWMKGAAVVVALSAMVGCAGEPVEGGWESSDDVGGKRNSLTIEDDGVGTATLYAYADGLYLTEVLFDVTWTAVGETRYEIDFECVGGDVEGSDFDECGELDFEAKCDIRGDDRMECEGEDAWDGYDLEWDRLY